MSLEQNFSEMVEAGRLAALQRRCAKSIDALNTGEYFRLTREGREPVSFALLYEHKTNQWSSAHRKPGAPTYETPAEAIAAITHEIYEQASTVERALDALEDAAKS